MFTQLSTNTLHVPSLFFCSSMNSFSLLFLVLCIGSVSMVSFLTY